MKKLMTMIAVAATAFGLFADDPPQKTFSTSFEANDTETQEGFAAAGWTGAEDGLIKFADYAGDAYVYGSDSFARRSDYFVDDTDQNKYVALETGTNEVKHAVNDTFLDQLVKFTGFEDVQTNFEGDVKIAIWMKGIEAGEGEPAEGETNLYITAATVKEATAEPVALKIPGSWEVEKWYRVTVKNIGNIYKGVNPDDNARAGFIVYIDGQQVACEEAKGIVDYESEMTPDAVKYMAKGQLFPAIDTSDVAFNSVGYKGKGAIDDIIADANGPLFAQTIEYTFAIDVTGVEGLEVDTVVGPDGKIDPDEDGKYTVADGSEVTITYVPAEGYKAMGNMTQTVEITSAKDVTPDSTIAAPAAVVATVTPADGDDAEYAECELYDLFMNDRLVDGDTVTFVAGGTVTNGEGDVFYDFTANTTIGVVIDAGATTWNIEVKTYDEGTDGTFYDWVGVQAGDTKNVTFETAGCAYADGEDGIEVAGTLKVACDNFGDFITEITLVGEGKLITQTAELENTLLPEGEIDVAEDTPEAGWYTYTIKAPAPTYVWVAADDDSAKYETIAAAITAGETEIKLIESATIAKETFGGDIVIDLGGATLTGAAGSVFDITSGNVVISNGVIAAGTQAEEYDATVTAEGGAQVTFGEALTVSCNKTMAAYATGEGTFVTVDGATIAQVGTETFNPEKGYKTAALTLKGKANGEIKAGTITGAAGFPIVIRGSSFSTLTITDGTIGAGEIKSDNDDTVVVNGGTFNGTTFAIGSGSEGCTINAGTFNACVWPAASAKKTTILGGSYVTAKPEETDGYTIPAAKKWVGEGTALTPWTLADKTPTTEIALSAASLELTEGGEVATLTATPNGDYGFTWSYDATSEYVGVTVNDNGSLTITGKVATVEAFVVTAVADDDDQITATCSITVKAAAPADPIPPVDPNAGEEVVNAAIDAVDYADKAAIKAAIGGDAQKYNAFAAWAKEVTGGQEAVIASTYAAKSFQLAPFVEGNVLFTDEPTLTTTAIAADTETAGNWTFTVKLTNGAKGELVALVEGIANCAKVSEDLATWDAATATAEINGGIATIKITPPEETDKAFMKVEVK